MIIKLSRSGKFSHIYLREDAYSPITHLRGLFAKMDVLVTLSHFGELPRSLFSNTAYHHKPLFFLS